MQIRKADFSDLTVIHPLFCDYLRFYKREVNPDRCFNFIHERLSKNESVIFVAEDNGIVLGFVQLYPSFSSLGQTKTWILNDLFVDSSKRKYGIGEKLIQAAIKYSQGSGASGLSLQTAHDNLAAQRLYIKLGWEKDDKYFTFYYSH